MIPRRTSFRIAALLLALGPALSPSRADDAAAARQEAETLYAAGHYGQALPVLEAIDAAGQATGPLLYRLAFCQREAGKTAEAQASEARALATLEGELDAAQTLEVPFYLVNAYRNAKRDADARRVAEAATAALDQGKLKTPRTGAEMFQLGKLHADSGHDEPAEQWYAKAVDALADSGEGGSSYVRWASRFVGENALRRQDFARAAKYLGIMTAAGEGSITDFDRLAVCRARTGDYAGAAEAWREAELQDPSVGDRFRYQSRVAELAASLPPRPERTPSGKLWIELTREELELMMKEQSERAKAILDEVAAETEIDAVKRDAYRKRLLEPKALFVPAAMEYVVRGHLIREQSFFGGYARLILAKNAWNVVRKKPAEPPPADPTATPPAPDAPRP